MASQKELFKLIKSLEKSEKQAITFERKRWLKDTNYFILYDWLEAQENELEEYDRKECAEEIHPNWKESTVRTAETQLYDKIIETLSFIQLKKSPTTAINQKIAEADVLKNKGFYTRSLEYLNKALTSAYKHQKYSLIVEIIPRKIDVILLTEYKNRKTQVEDSYRELRVAIQTIQQEANFRSLNVRLLIQYQESRNPKNIENSIKEDYSALIAKKFPIEGSFFSKYYFYSVQAIWENIHKNYKEAYKHQEAVVQLWRENVPIQVNNGQLYLTQLANFANYAIAAKEFEDANKVILLMKEFAPNNQDEKAEQAQNLLFYKQFALLNQEKFEEARQLIPAIEKLLLESEQEEKEDSTEQEKLTKKEKKEKIEIFYNNRINPARLYNFYYNTLITLLLCNQYEDANKWLVKIRSFYQKKEPRKDIRRVIRILQLIINYGLGSSEFSQNMFESLYRKKTVRENMGVFEECLLEFFKEINRPTSPIENYKPYFENLLKELESLELKDKKVVGYYEVYLWVQSQL